MFIVLTGLLFSVVSYAQTDSIITYSNLKFHSDLEQIAFDHLTRLHTDTLNAFLGVNENLSTSDFEKAHQSFNDLIKGLEVKNFGKKSVKVKLKLIFAAIKKKCQITYDRDGTVATALLNGTFNEWSVTPIAAMLLDHFQIPYTLLYSSNQLRLVVNFGPNEVTLDANNPYPIVFDYPFEYQQRYVEFMHTIGRLTDSDMRQRSVNELFEEYSKKEQKISITQLLGLEYYNLSNTLSKLGNYAACLLPAQKGYYVYPLPETGIVLLNGLSEKMNHFAINTSTDIDYLIQFCRASGIDAVKTSTYISNLFTKMLQDPEKVPLCDSVFNRLMLQTKDQKVIDEVGFTYNVMRINQKNLSYKDLFFADMAASIQPNNKELCKYAEFILVDFLGKIEDEQTRKDSIESLSNKLKSKRAQETLKAQRMALLLNMAKEAYGDRKLADGERLLQEFEASCPPPVKNEGLLHDIELAYYDMAVAVYWSNKQDYAANALMIQRGLKYVPDSEIIKSGAYEKKDNQATSKKKKEKVYTFH